MDQLVVFTLDNSNFALPLKAVIRVIHAIEITCLPKSPEIVSGIINIHGQIIPVIDVRKRFGRQTQELKADDQMIIADTGKRLVALWINLIIGIRKLESRQKVSTKQSLPFIEYIGGIAKLDNELILIYDLEQFLNLNEESDLDEALAKL